MSAKAYRDKKAITACGEIKRGDKKSDYQCVQLTEQGKKLTAKWTGNRNRLVA